MFKITSGKGFHLIFKNGVTLSTQIGWGNYCDNYNFSGDMESIMKKNSWESKDCEIGIWDKNKNWITKQMNKELFNEKNSDDVKGYVNFKNWLKIVDWCKNYKN